VADRRAERKETWAATMEAWNDFAEDAGFRNTYWHVSNFLRDYHRAAVSLGHYKPKQRP
jgi:hypothetical protein